MLLCKLCKGGLGPVNLWMHSLFSDVSVSLNEKLVSPPTSLYPYIAYIEALLSYSSFPNICTDLLWAVNAFWDVNPLLSAVVLS
jgi:hypothetical protein